MQSFPANNRITFVVYAELRNNLLNSERSFMEIYDNRLLPSRLYTKLCNGDMVELSDYSLRRISQPTALKMKFAKCNR